MTQQETIVLAYDGSEEARHAISAAAGLLGPRRADVVHIWEPVASAASRSAIYADAGSGAAEELAREARRIRHRRRGRSIARSRLRRPTGACADARPDQRRARRLRHQGAAGARRRRQPRSVGRPLGGSRQRLTPRNPARQDANPHRPRRPDVMANATLPIPDPTLSIAGKVAIVTGAAAGIGRATAEVLAARGATVVIGDINGVSAERVAAELRERGASAIGVAADMGDESQIEGLIQTAIDAYGRLDLLHNNAALTAGEAAVGTWRSPTSTRRSFSASSASMSAVTPWRQARDPAHDRGRGRRGDQHEPRPTPCSPNSCGRCTRCRRARSMRSRAASPRSTASRASELSASHRAWS